jgi:hypothetical protein
MDVLYHYRKEILLFRRFVKALWKASSFEEGWPAGTSLLFDPLGRVAGFVETSPKRPSKKYFPSSREFGSAL